MKINISLTDGDLEKLTFRLEETSDRQDQPMKLTDTRYWPEALENDHAWRYCRWDMFCINVLVPITWHEHELDLYSGNKPLYGFQSQIGIATFFIHPDFQDPTVPMFGQQPTVLSVKDHEKVREAAGQWFVQQPQYQHMIRWGLSAMREMRDILALAGKLDVEWWTVFEKNTRKIERKGESE